MEKYEELVTQVIPLLDLLPASWRVGVELLLTCIGALSLILAAAKPLIVRLPPWLDTFIAALDVLAANTSPIWKARTQYEASKHTTRLSRIPPAAILLLAVVCLAGCRHGGERWREVVWPTAVECAPGWDDLVGTVTRILIADGEASKMSQRGRDELERLASEHGPGTVACLVEQLRQRWSGAGAAQETVLIAASLRAEAFLADVGTTVVLTSGGGP